MKSRAYYLMILGLFISLSVFWACSDNQESMPLVEKNQYEVLNLELQDLNESFVSSSDQQTRGRGWLRKALNIAAADLGSIVNTKPTQTRSIIGWVIGLVELVRCISASIHAANLEPEHTFPLIEARGTDISQSLEAINSVAYLDNENLGKLHNQVIINLVEKDSLIFSKSTDEIIYAVNQELNTLIGARMMTTEELKEIKRENTIFFAEIIKGEPLNVFKNLMVKYPSKADELQLMDTYFTKVSTLTSINDLIEYSKLAREIIQNSQIDINAKNELLGIIDLSINSSWIWNGDFEV